MRRSPYTPGLPVSPQEVVNHQKPDLSYSNKNGVGHGYVFTKNGYFCSIYVQKYIGTNKICLSGYTQLVYEYCCSNFRRKMFIHTNNVQRNYSQSFFGYNCLICEQKFAMQTPKFLNRYICLISSYCCPNNKHKIGSQTKMA